MDDGYAERRTVPLKATLQLIAAFALIAVFKALTGDTDGRTLTFGVGALAAGVLLFVAIGASPIGPFFKHVRVDGEGLHVGSKLLPTRAIGRTWCVAPGEARSAVPRGRFEGLKVTRSSFGWLVTEDGAVVVEDTAAARPSAWLVATRDPETLASALDEVGRRASA